jgi:uncharacterized protein YhaN
MTVIFGQNEAGKSTLLAFVRAILFGFPSSRSKENRYEPWCGGMVQGSLDMRTGEGSLYRISRTAGPKGGQVEVFKEGRLVGSKEALEALLGPVGADVFRKVFAFSLLELQDLGTLQEGEVREALYGAGSGGIRVAAVEKALLEAAQGLFKNAGNAKAPLNLLLREIDQQEKKLAGMRLLPERYARLMAQVEELEVSLSDLARQEELHLTTRDRLQALLRAWPIHRKALDLRAEIGELPELEDFPVDGVTRLEVLERLQDDLKRELVKTRRDLEDLRERLGLCQANPRILAVAEPIARLHAGSERWEERLHRIPALEERVSWEQENLAREMRSLGSNWDEERVRAQDLSVGLRENLQRGRSRLQEAETAHRQMTVRLQEADDSVQAHLEREASSREALIRSESGDPRLAELDPAVLASTLEACRRAQDEAEGLTRAEEEARLACNDLPEGGLLAVRPRSEELRGWGCRLQELYAQVQAAEQKAELAREAREEACPRLAQDEVALEALPRPRFSEEEARARAEVLRRARQSQARQRQLESDQQAAATRVQALGRTAGSLPAFLPVLIALAALSLATYLGWLQQQWILAGVCLVLGLALAGWLGKLVRSQAVVSSELESARTELARLDLELEKVRQEGSDALAGQELEEAEIQLADDTERRSRWQAADQTLSRARTDLDLLQQKAARASEAADQARLAWHEGCGAWEAWCRDRRLPVGSPEAQMDFLTRLDVASRARRQVETARERLARVHKSMERGRSRLTAPLAEMGRDLPKAAPDLLDSLVRLEAEAEQARRFAGDARDRRLRHEQAVQDLEEARSKRLKAAEECEQAREALEEARRFWIRTAEDAGLDPKLTPDSALDVFGRLGNLQRGLSGLEQLRLELHSLRQEQQALLELARETARQVGLRPCDQAGWVALVDTLVGAREEALTNLARRQELERNLQEAEEVPIRLQLELAQVDERLAELLKAGGASGTEDFRRRSEQWIQLLRLRDELRQQERAREALGVEPRDLEASSPSELEAQDREQVSRLDELRDQRVQVAEERTRLQVEIEQMVRAEESSSLAQALEVSRARARQLARDWAVKTLAWRLVGRARQTFERERQPFVLQRAAEHFTRLTAGNYVRVYHPLEESQLRVETAEGISRLPEALSRGTAEQLYLALRLGFVEDFSRERDPLPLVMDDIFVNFDGPRASRALEVLGEMAGRHQVLIFTCHAETVERARRLGPQVQVIDLDEEVARVG